MLNSDKEPVRSFRWTGSPAEVDWDGSSDSGVRVPDGVYGYRLSAIDDAGNAFEFSLSGIRIDTRGTPIQVHVLHAGFSPNGDGRNDKLTIQTRTEISEGIAGWRLEAVDATTAHRSPVLVGGRLPAPGRIEWDGSLVTGEKPGEGRYYVAYTVDYDKGNRSEARTAEFVLDTTGPALELTVRPSTFSPDGDHIDDTVRLDFRAVDANGVESWQLRILDPTDVLFTQFSGIGAPRNPIVWDGKAPNDDLVLAGGNYRAVLSARDMLGNSNVAAKPVSVDVYVIPEGDRLRIKLSTIFFAPFLPDFAPEKEKENREVLRRLAEILQKYPAYRIRIEGHAVRIYWFDEAYGRREEAEELAPLSVARAENVKRALIALGIEESRMSTAGFGGTRPVVPHSDLVNRWKNRRAEFVLEKP